MQFTSRWRNFTNVDTSTDFSTLRKLNITIDYGRVHNKNKNPVIDKGISELISELLHINPDGGQTNAIELSLATNQLNGRIRGRGLSAWEIVSQRDGSTGTALDIDDEILSMMQTVCRNKNQISSSKFKARGGNLVQPADVSVGSLVYIKQEKSKLKARDRYMITKMEGEFCVLKKLLKSKLRDKEYRLKTTEIYPVSSNVINNESYATQGIEISEDEDELMGLQSQPPHPRGEKLPCPQPPPASNVAPHIPATKDVDVPNLVYPVDAEVSILDDPTVEEIPLSIEAPADESLPMQEEECRTSAPPRRGTRDRKKPSWMKDYETEKGKK